MQVRQVSILFAVCGADYSAFIAQAFMRAGGAISMVQVRSAEDLLGRLAESLPALLVIDLDRDWRVLEQVRTRYPRLPVVAIVSRSTPEMGFALARLHVEDVWISSPQDDSMEERAEAVLRKLRIAPLAPAAANDLPPKSPAIQDSMAIAALKGDSDGVAPSILVGGNPGMKEIRDTIEKVAGTDVTVLIRGESGVGKEVAARLLFENSRRKLKPFIKVNCAAIPHDLLESELFGYEAGAFTGAVRSKPGKFEMADRGTLFLDEIAEMHPSLQAKLLHVLQDGRFSRLGAKKDVAVDVRIICATNKPLEERVREGMFREDLLYRINVVTIFVPPLRERRDEIPVLTNYLLRKFAAQYGRELHPLGPEVMEKMLAYEWPGNIRELENLCKRFVLVGNETQIFRELSGRTGLKAVSSEATFPPVHFAENPVNNISEASTAGSLQPGLSLLEVGRRAAWEAERRAILQMLEVTHWNRREASRRLQVSYKALLNKIKQMNLETDHSASAADRHGNV
jgi:DNA-binding NtrC family response regulator